MTTVILLILSNIFMAFAWYGHLKYVAPRALSSWGWRTQLFILTPSSKSGNDKGRNFPEIVLKISGEIKLIKPPCGV